MTHFQQSIAFQTVLLEYIKLPKAFLGKLHTILKQAPLGGHFTIFNNFIKVYFVKTKFNNIKFSGVTDLRWHMINVIFKIGHRC